MNTDTQKPSEHAMRAAIEIGRNWLNRETYEDAQIIDNLAISPAVAERDKRIAELEERCALLGDALMKIEKLQDEWQQWEFRDLYECSRSMAKEARISAIFAKKGQP